MTDTNLVNTVTGEVLDPVAAERRAEQIGLALDGAADRFETAMEKMRAAIRDRDDVALGYRSPGDYLSDRFGGKLARLGVDLRREVVRELTEAGLSTRAIAPIVGVSNVTVQKDRHAAGVNPVNTSPDPTTPVVGATPAQPESPKVAPDEEKDTAAATVLTDDPTAATPQAETPATPRPAVIGIDGKTYKRPTPRPDRRPPLTDAYGRAIWDLDKTLRKLERLHSDDRFIGHRDGLRTSHGPLIGEMAWVLMEIENHLEGFNNCPECKSPKPPNRMWRDDPKELCDRCRSEDD